ncbi:MAG: Fic family protein [Elusimicrobia bacterium]|nr:Fic family protein [Elusimicrobiota bacterium]
MTPLSELIFGTSENKEAKRLRRLLRAGQARKIAPRLYTTNLTDLPEKIVRDNYHEILGRLFPKAVISHRTALEGKPTASWEVFLTSSYPRKVVLPGLTVRIMKGPPAGIADKPFMVGDLFLASEPRAFLENLQPSRRGATTSKAISRQELEERLERTLRLRGEKALNNLRDEARRVANESGFLEEFKSLDAIIGAMLKTKPASGLQSALAKARAAGEAFDPERLRVFEALFSALKQTPLRETAEAHTNSEALRVLAFFESYFSNYIEGTKFEVDQAHEIVFEGRIPITRPKDAHDVLGTYRVVSNIAGLSERPQAMDSFWTLLSTRHEAMLGARPEIRPGEMKMDVNRAGDTVFVVPDLVRGTLARGLEFYKVLDSPSARAAFMMFLVSEVHPFNDGNGRIARVMMNAELVAAGLRRIIIPTVFRDDYLGALRALSRRGDPGAYLRMFDYAQLFSASIDFSDFPTARRALEAANAFKDPGEAKLVIRKSE